MTDAPPTEGAAEEAQPKLSPGAQRAAQERSANAERVARQRRANKRTGAKARRVAKQIAKTDRKRRKVGRPTLFDANKSVAQARNLALLGLTEGEIASALKINDSTFVQWKRRYPEFASAIEDGQVVADASIAGRLYSRAYGMTVSKAIKLKDSEGNERVEMVEDEVLPDVNAIRFWLTNRQPHRWRDRREVEVSGGIEHVIAALPAEEKAERLTKLLESAAKLIEGEAVEVGASDDVATDEASEA